MTSSCGRPRRRAAFVAAVPHGASVYNTPVSGSHPRSLRGRRRRRTAKQRTSRRDSAPRAPTSAQTRSGRHRRTPAHSHHQDHALSGCLRATNLCATTLRDRHALVQVPVLVQRLRLREPEQRSSTPVTLSINSIKMELFGDSDGGSAAGHHASASGAAGTVRTMRRACPPSQGRPGRRPGQPG
jgi:hypothetical protein